MRYRIFFLFSLLLPVLSASAQFPIRGVVADMATGKPIANVVLENIYTRSATTTDSAGNFLLTADRGQLLEFRKLGYKVTRVRIPAGQVPPQFRILMEEGSFELQEVLVRERFRDYKTDSIRYRELYKRELEFQELKGVEAIKHPFSALSKRNRQIWAFQKEYNAFEKLKYIDYTFNDRVIGNITGLSGDSLYNYRLKYRPSYEALRSMNEYQFFNYIKQTASRFRAYGR